MRHLPVQLWGKIQDCYGIGADILFAETTSFILSALSITSIANYGVQLIYLI